MGWSTYGCISHWEGQEVDGEARFVPRWGQREADLGMNDHSQGWLLVLGELGYKEREDAVQRGGRRLHGVGTAWAVMGRGRKDSEKGLRVGGR